ncbi:MAG: Rid family detoxifying hydrolase [Acidimicrobiia bacterium]|nr:Rid family detoxifying hydrolase [Acidimicrobiia bacterium]
MPKTIHKSANGPKALGPYSVATEAHGFVFMSGMIGVDPSNGVRAAGGVVEETHQVMKNIGAVLGDLDLTYEDIVKTTIFLDDIDDFSTVNAVYAEYVGEAKPARSTVQAGALPGGFLVEVECIAARP